MKRLMFLAVLLVFSAVAFAQDSQKLPDDLNLLVGKKVIVGRMPLCQPGAYTDKSHLLWETSNRGFAEASQSVQFFQRRSEPHAAGDARANGRHAQGRNIAIPVRGWREAR
jgi:hypothetical protein